MTTTAPTKLERFAFNQARFVYVVWHTIDRIEAIDDFDEIQNRLISWKDSQIRAYSKIKETELGKKYLGNVTLEEVLREGRKPGSFMNANTDLGHYLPNEDGCSYVETFNERS
jgi:hypothetical protein